MGERADLRAGTNGIVCIQKDENTGFTRCIHERHLSQMDLRMTLAAAGKTNEEITAAIQVARERGDIAPRQFGDFSYRLYDGDEDRLKLLWVVSLPGVTAAETGMPIEADRKKLGSGQGTPWLMREGTDQAHLMIPINGTPLSNIY